MSARRAPGSTWASRPTGPARPTRLRRPALLTRLGGLVATAVVLAGCAGVPVAVPTTAATDAVPAVVVDQAAQVRAEVAARLLEARLAGDPALVGAAAVGPAAALEQLRVRVDGPQPGAVALRPAQASVLVAPLVDGWPRWFATVTDPALAPAPDDVDVPDADAVPTGSSAGADPEASDEPEPSAAEAMAGADPTTEPSAGGDATAGEDVAGAELPVIELYDAQDPRSPYRLWARMTMLPGAELPAFADPLLGAGSLGDGLAAAQGASVELSPTGSAPTGSAPTGSDGPAAPDDVAVADEADLLAVLDGLATRYASVMTDGDASEAAAEFEPDPFVDAVRARTDAERAAVAAVAGLTVTHEPLDGVEVLYAARTLSGDVLAITAVTSTTTLSVREGAGTLTPDAELRAAAGIDRTDGTLTARSVAALAFVVPAEQGAIRLVAVGEGLVAAEAQ